MRHQLRAHTHTRTPHIRAGTYARATSVGYTRTFMKFEFFISARVCVPSMREAPRKNLKCASSSRDLRERGETVRNALEAPANSYVIGVYDSTGSDKGVSRRLIRTYNLSEYRSFGNFARSTGREFARIRNAQRHPIPSGYPAD